MDSLSLLDGAHGLKMSRVALGIVSVHISQDLLRFLWACRALGTMIGACFLKA